MCIPHIQGSVYNLLQWLVTRACGENRAALGFAIAFSAAVYNRPKSKLWLGIEILKRTYKRDTISKIIGSSSNSMHDNFYRVVLIMYSSVKMYSSF